MTYDRDRAHGSARFAQSHELRHAGLLKPGGLLEFGRIGRHSLRHHDRTAILVKGGAGSGKTTALLLPMLLSTSANVAMIDVKGELTAVLMDGLVHHGAALLSFNPYRLHGLPAHCVSLLSHLKPGSPYLVGDSRRVWQAILPDISGAQNRFFDEKGRQWGEAITRALVYQRGGVSLASLYETINLVRADWDAFVGWAADAAPLCPPDIAATFGELISMNTGEARTFDSVMSGITAALGFMADPALRACLPGDEQGAVRLDALTSGQRQIFFTIILPPEFITIYAPLVRLILSCISTAKQRAPYAAPMLMVIDEAARLGSFTELAELPAIGRGYGLVPVLTYQDDGQIALNLGPHGAATLSANAGIELYLGGGIRDLTTATALSRRLGNQTITLIDPLTRARGQFARREALRQVLIEGADPVRIGHELRRAAVEEQHESRQSRALLEPSEVLGLPGSKTLVLAGGYELPPFIADKVPYFLRREFAGRVFPNPYVQRDMSTLRVPGRFGMRTRRISEAPVPSWAAHLPQYQDGRPLRYIEGYKSRAQQPEIITFGGS